MLKKVTITAFGQDHICTREGSTNTYKVSAVTPSKSSYTQEGHYYPIVVKAEDEAGNVKTVDVSDAALGNLLKLVVKETVAPTINITSPTADTKTAQKRPKIVFEVKDNDSGVNESTVELTFNGQQYTVSDFTRQTITDGYKYEYTPSEDLSDDTYTATVNASDNDGNAAAPKSVTFEIYAAAPTLSVTSPAEDLVTNQTTVQYKETTNGASLAVTVNGTPQAINFSAGTATGTLTLSEGENTIISTATSETGVETSVTRTVTLDTKAPVISNIEISENPANTGDTIVFTVTVTD